MANIKIISGILVAALSIIQLFNSCEKNNQNPVPEGPVGNSPQVFCDCNNPKIRDLKAIGSNINWYADPLSNVPLAESENILNNTIYYASQTVNGYESEQRCAVTVMINHTEPPTGEAIQRFCTLSVPVPTVTNINVNGSGIHYYLSPQGGNELSDNSVLTSGDYYVTQSIDECESLNRLKISVITNFCHDSIVLKLEGDWTCSEQSEIYKSTSETYTVHITPNPTVVNNIIISNFYGLNTTAKAVISGYSITLNKQNLEGGFNIEGSGIISDDLNEITLTYIVDDGSGLVDHCTAIYSR